MCLTYNQSSHDPMVTLPLYQAFTTLYQVVKESTGVPACVTPHMLMLDTASISAMPHARSIPDDAKETMKKLRSSGMPVKENSRAMQVAHPCNYRLHPCDSPLS